MTLFSCLPVARWGDVGHLGSASPNKITANKAFSDNNYYDKQTALCYPNILGTRHDIGAAPSVSQEIHQPIYLVRLRENDHVYSLQSDTPFTDDIAAIVRLSKIVSSRKKFSRHRSFLWSRYNAKKK